VQDAIPERASEPDQLTANGRLYQPPWSGGRAGSAMTPVGGVESKRNPNGTGADVLPSEWKWKRILIVLPAALSGSGIAVCARKDVAQERAAKSELEREFLPIVPSARPPYGSRVEGYDFVETQGQSAMDSVLQNGRDVQEALTKAAQRIDREFLKK